MYFASITIIHFYGVGIKAKKPPPPHHLASYYPIKHIPPLKKVWTKTLHTIVVPFLASKYWTFLHIVHQRKLLQLTPKWKYQFTSFHRNTYSILSQKVHSQKHLKKLFAYAHSSKQFFILSCVADPNKDNSDPDPTPILR